LRQGDNVGSVGVDATLFFTERIGFTGQYLQTHGPVGSDGAAWFVRPAYDSTNLHFHVRYTNLDPGILDDVNAVGFLRYDNRAGCSFELVVSEGENFGDDLWLYEAAVAFKITDAWNLDYELTYLDLKPDLAGRSTWINVLRTTYYFTNDLYTKLFLQNNTAIEKENIQLLVVWRILPPFGSLQVAYQRGTSELGEQSEQGNTLFAKLSWVF
jgi:hypothetical protein